MPTREETLRSALAEEFSQKRREKFYAEEGAAFDRDRRHVRPEEPNVRVYARSVKAVLETAQRGLSGKDFSSLCQMLAAEFPEFSGPTKKVSP